MNFIKIPREIIYSKDIGDKRVILFTYLCMRRAVDNTVGLTIDELCRWSKIKPDPHQGRINEKYVNTMIRFSEMGYFQEDIDKETFLYTNQYKYHLLKLNVEKFDIQREYAAIYFDELEKILNFKDELKNDDIVLSRMSPAYLLLLLSYFRINMYRGDKFPKCCYRHYKTISEDIGISERYVSRIASMLDALKITKSIECARIKYKNEDNTIGFYTNMKVFADYRNFKKVSYGRQVIDEDYDCDKEINWAMKRIAGNYIKSL